MNRLPKLVGILVLCSFICSLGMFAGEKIQSVRSTQTVTPRYIPSLTEYLAKGAKSALSEGDLEHHPELSNMTEEELEELKDAPKPKWDGKGILTIDKSANRNLKLRSPNDALSPLGPALGTNFEGNLQGGGRPGDLMMAVGPNHVISVANSTIRIRTKANTGIQTLNASTFYGVQFPTGLGFFDPKVLYDVVAGHFIVLFDYESDSPLLASYYVAVSATPDPNAGWYLYNFDMMKDGDTPTINFADFPGLGVDNTSIYMTGNMYTTPVASGTYQYVKVRVVSKNLMYAGFPVTYADITTIPGGGVFTLKPANCLSVSNEEYLFWHPNGGGGSVGVYRIIDAPGAPSMEKLGQLPVSGYGVVPNAPQDGCTGSNSTLETGDDRTGDPVWRDGYLYAAQHVGIDMGGTVAAIKYYKINTTTATVVTDEVYGAPGTFYYYPAVTVDAGGTVFISYSRSSPTENASAWYSGKRRFDTNIQPSAILKPGATPYWCGSSGPRWGDYTGIAIDPVTDINGAQSSAWVDGNWAKGPSVWGSWIGKVTFFFHSINGKVLNDCDSTTATTGDRLPIALTTVTLHRDTTLIGTTMTDSAGNYSFGSLNDGMYYVTLTLPPASGALQSIPGNGADSQFVVNATKLQVYLSGGGIASQTSSNNNFAVVLTHPVPTTTSLSPDSYPMGEPGFVMTVNGTNFEPCSVVRVDGSDRATTYVSSTQLHASILTSDITALGSHFITVFTGTPGGGTSNSQTFTVVAPYPIFSVTPTSLDFGTRFLGVATTESLAVTNNGTSPLNITLASSDNGEFTASPANASIARQATEYFLVTYTPATLGSVSGHIIFTHNAASSPDAADVTGNGKDSTALRTATANDWATAVDIKNKHKGMPHKPDKVFFKFNLITPVAGTTGTTLALDFSMDVVGVIHSAKLAHDTVAVFSGKKPIILFNPQVAGNHEIEIEGVGNKGKKVTAKFAWGIDRKKDVTTIGPYKRNETGLPRPNLNNVGEELFPKGFGQASPYFSDANPLIIGLPVGPKGASSVKIKKYTNVIASFIDVRSGTKHQLGPKCLSRFDNFDSIKSQLASLSPLKQNNKLFAELLAFKLNIAASVAGKFPLGLGELEFNDPADTGNPFNGFLLKDIASKIDTILSCRTLTTIVPTPTLQDAYDVLSMLNATFAGGGNFKDTVTFLAKTRLTGVLRLGDIPYLKKVPGIVPATFLSPDIINGGIPLAYALYQNYPNPFNPTTNIAFDLPQQANVTLKVYNILGQEVATLFDHQLMDEGVQEAEFNASLLPSGVYFYRIIAEGVSDDDEGIVGQRFMDVKKMILVR